MFITFFLRDANLVVTKRDLHDEPGRSRSMKFFFVWFFTNGGTHGDAEEVAGGAGGGDRSTC